MILTMGEVIYFNTDFMIYLVVLLLLTASFGSNDIVDLLGGILKTVYNNTLEKE